MRVPASGGEPFAITDLDKQKGEISHRGVQLLPGGETFLFGASNDNNVWEDATIQIQSVKTGQRKTLVRGGYFGHYIHGSDPSEGHLIYMHGGTLFAAPMDVKSLELTSPASPVLQDVASRRESGVAQLGFTASGTLVYVAGSNINPQESLFWVDAAGNAQVLPAASGEYIAPRVSPDGSRIAAIVSDGSGRNLAVYEWAQNRMTRLTFKGAVTSPAWTPDGKHVVCALASAESSGIYWIRSDGAGEPQRLIEGQNLTPRSFSPDGKRLAYSRGGPPDRTPHTREYPASTVEL
jgi:dipeptidyl aminopeptidase/acylaminoacyl peptidase